MARISQEQYELLTPFGIDELRYSSLTKLLNVTTYEQRFVEKIKKKQSSFGSLKRNEIQKAEKLLFKYVQQKHFMIKEGYITKELQNSQVNPNIHEDRIIRLHGKLQNANIPDDSINPIIFPRKGSLTRLIMEDIHRRLLHSSPSHTLTQIRNKYWIPKGRMEVKKILKKFLICVRYQGGPYKMKPLAPKSKVIESRVFEHTGLDYFGPLHIKQNKERKKACVCIFISITVRGIHVEIVEDMASEKCLLALRRFVARGGKPNEIISDNAPHFKVIKNTIDILWKNVISGPSIRTYLNNERIKWSFITELSPWMGGFYERLVGITKRSLRKSIGKLSLSSL